MLVRALRPAIVALILIAGFAIDANVASAGDHVGHVGRVGVEAQAATAPTIPPDETFNEFLPEERGLGECISAIEKPGCGSKARGGWRQGLIALALVSGLAFIAWRIVRSVRSAPRDRSDATKT